MCVCVCILFLCFFFLFFFSSGLQNPKSTAFCVADTFFLSFFFFYKFVLSLFFFPHDVDERTETAHTTTKKKKLSQLNSEDVRKPSK